MSALFQTVFTSRLRWWWLWPLVAVWAYLSWELLDQRQQLLAQEQQRLVSQTRLLEDMFSRQLAAASAAMASVRRDLPYMQQQPDQLGLLSLRLQSLCDAMPGIRTMTVLDAQGVALASNRPDLVGRDFAYRDYLKPVRQAPNPDVLYVSAPFKTVLGVFAMNVSRVQVDEAGRLMRVFVVTLDPDFFGLVMSSVRYAHDMWVGLAHGDGVLVSHQPERPDLLGAQLLQRPGSLLQKHLDSGQVETVVRGQVVLTGEQVLLAHRTVQPAALRMDRPLLVAVGRNEWALLRPWREKAYTVWALLALMTLGIFGWWKVYQQRQQRMLAALHHEEMRRQQAEAEIRQMAYQDPLTQLPNRRLAHERLRQLLAASLRRRHHGALLYLDLDDFKALNDTRGHDQGDVLLKQVAGRLLGAVRAEDTVARLGGDEFIVLLSDLSSDLAQASEQAQQVARKLLQLLNETGETAAMPCPVSIGVAVFGGQWEEDAEAVLKRADRAMYAAKTAGRNTWRLADPPG